MTSQKETDYHYAEDAAGNAISEQYSYTTTNDGETLAVEYDDNGNTTRVVTVAADGLSTTTRTFEWDGNDRMRTITYDDGSRTEFEYDYMGRRVQIEEYDDTASLTERRTFLWDGLRIAQERIDRLNPDGDVEEEVTKTYFPQGEDHSGDSAAEYLYTRDHLGSVREVVDAADGSLEARYDYTPWGERTQTAGAVKAEFAFTGHHYHEKSGLHLAPYREYSAEMGRWMSRDPIQEMGGINLYAYVGSVTINNTDKLGLMADQAAKHALARLAALLGISAVILSWIGACAFGRIVCAAYSVNFGCLHPTCSALNGFCAGTLNPLGAPKCGGGGGREFAPVLPDPECIKPPGTRGPLPDGILDDIYKPNTTEVPGYIDDEGIPIPPKNPYSDV